MGEGGWGVEERRGRPGESAELREPLLVFLPILITSSANTLEKLQNHIKSHTQKPCDGTDFSTYRALRCVYHDRITDLRGHVYLVKAKRVLPGDELPTR